MTNISKVKKFTAAQLTKAGFVRAPEKDFRDDGSTFKVYAYRDITVTYTTYQPKSGGSKRMVYLDVDVDCSKYAFTFNDLLNAGLRPLMCEFNGVPEEEVNVEKLKKNCDTISDKIVELNEKAEKEDVRVDLLQAEIDSEIKNVEYAIQYFKVNFNWFDAEDYVIQRGKRYVTSALAVIKSYKDLPLEKRSKKILRELSQNFTNWGFIDGSLNSYRTSLMDMANGKSTF